MHRSVASHTTQIGTWPATQAHGSPDEESNWQPFGSKAGAQSTEPHQPGQPTLSHTASCVIVTALQWALPHDPSALLTSFAHKPCFCIFAQDPTSGLLRIMFLRPQPIQALSSQLLAWPTPCSPTLTPLPLLPLYCLLRSTTHLPITPALVSLFGVAP